MSNQHSELPVLQGHWRLLEPDETILATDESLVLTPKKLDWWIVPESWVGTMPIIGGAPIRRRVAPIPKCETCHWFSKDDEGGCMACKHEEGLAIADANDYCSKHKPQSQEVTR